MADVTADSDTGSGASRMRVVRKAIVIALLMAALAYALLLLPYARALWWLHAQPLAEAELLVPVAGVPAEALEANFGAPRRGHMHEGIDIMASAGTPVVATAPGIVIGNRPTPIGGIVLWILGSGRRLYYYAHMRELTPGMHMGRLVEAGTRIGSVGNTGNAVTTPPHLHFAIYQVTSDFYPMRYHPIDPYPLLTDLGKE